MTLQKHEQNPIITVAVITGIFGIITAIIGGCFLITNTIVQNSKKSETNTPFVLVASQTIETPVPAFTNSIPADIPTAIPTITPTTILPPSFTPVPTNTNIPPTPAPYVKGQESFHASPAYPPTPRHIVLSDGELYVGTAVRFAAYTYGCNTMDTPSNIPYTVLLIRGPIEVDVIIDNGGWDYWVNVYDENFAKSLLEPKRDEVKRHPNYPTVGYVECIIPPFK